MKYYFHIIVLLIAVALGNAMGALTDSAIISCTSNAGFCEKLAAKEIRRYVYLRTGELLPIVEAVNRAEGSEILLKVDSSLAPQQYRLRTQGQTLNISGGTDIAVLYGAYHLIEKLGVRFYLHGDVIPDNKIAFNLPQLDETHSPLFDKRGILPFHDFPEGPDWWDEDDYKAYFSQMPKMRMNFAAFHCYPEGGVGPEPLVWIGLKDDVDEHGKVTFAYPSRWASVDGGAWGYQKCKTSDFTAGAGLLFADDSFGPEVTKGYRPKPTTLEDSITVFEQASEMLSNAYAHAHDLGIKICLGTETPLTIPKNVKERLQEKGIDPKSPAAVQELYEGMFTRIARAYPVDYYWLWTPENWTWGGNNQQQLDATVADIKAALEALHAVDNPFRLATCGWVLGPQNDRAALDKLLPKEVAVSCINRQLGFTPVDVAFARIDGRSKWAIPWLEDDPDMINPQFWVGRMRRDAADALWYGCDGLLGIHWRTRILAPNMSALAEAAWEQADWNPDFGKNVPLPKGRLVDVYNGGQIAGYKNPIAATHDDAIYQTCRYNLNSYHIKVPDGVYDVTLKFCEVAYKNEGKRIFGVKVQGKQVLEHLDVFARAGANKALDHTFSDIQVENENLKIEFTREVEYPFIAGIEIKGIQKATNQFAERAFSRKINCGGQAYKDYEKDLEAQGSITQDKRPRDYTSDDFYRDWAKAEFGPEAAEQVAKIFQRLDGGGTLPGHDAAIPRPSQWIAGPGGIKTRKKPWSQVKANHAYVEEMEVLRSGIRGSGNLERFDYWLNTFRYNRAMDELACGRGKLDTIIDTLKKTEAVEHKKKIVREQALPARIELARLWEKLMNIQLQRVTNASELGEISNLEQHNRGTLQYLNKHDKLLQDILGQPLPQNVHLSKDYTGPVRLVVPTVRTQLNKGENLEFKVIMLDSQKPQEAKLYFRPLGQGRFKSIDLSHVNRCVYQVTVPAQSIDGDFEYYIQTTSHTGKKLVFPATAPEMNQTVIVLSENEKD